MLTALNLGNRFIYGANRITRGKTTGLLSIFIEKLLIA
jgi:hypothetical protein